MAEWADVTWPTDHQHDGIKNILVFSIPNSGHLNILKKMLKLYSGEFNFEFVLVDQKNTKPAVSDMNAKVHIPAATAGFRNTPEHRVFGRVAKVLPECLSIARNFRPDLIIYDFPAIEGQLVGQILDVPAWASIPGLIGPFQHTAYRDRCLASAENQQALNEIHETHGLEIDPAQVEIISNCLHMPGERNLLWSYPATTPTDYMQNRQAARYSFVGYLADPAHLGIARADHPVVYFSLGTEVMDNLWVIQKTTRDALRARIAELAEMWAGSDLDVIFSAQRKTVLENYPDNWKVFNEVDQQKVLRSASVFITHGGSNSFHEAILCATPMAVIPFFGDQPLVASVAEQLGVGISLVDDSGIRRGKPKDFLGPGLAHRIDKTVLELIRNDDYQRAFTSIPLATESLFH